MLKRLAMLVVGTLSMVSLSGCGHGTTVGATKTVPANAQVVHVTASSFKWTLDKTTFQAGKPIDFVVNASDNAHGFSIDKTNISQQVVSGQPAVNVVWTPQKPGTYIIRCDYFCGSGHPDMTTAITVQ